MVLKLYQNEGTKMCLRRKFFVGQERPTSGLLAESTVERIHILDVIGLSRFEDNRVFAPDMLNGHALDVMEGVASSVEVVATGLGGLFGGDVVSVFSESCVPEPFRASCVPGGKSRFVTSVLLAPPDVDQPLSLTVEGLGDVVMTPLVQSITAWYNDLVSHYNLDLSIAHTII